MLEEKKRSLLVNYLKENTMPEYLIKIGNREDKKTKKMKIFSGCPHDAETEMKQRLEKGEYIISVSNNSFPMGQYRAVRSH